VAAKRPGGVAAAGRRLVFYLLRDMPWMIKNIGRVMSKYLIAQRSKVSVADSIVPLALIRFVRIAVDFDRKPWIEAEKVRNIGTGRRLPPNLEAIGLQDTQFIPERRFGFCREMAKPLRLLTYFEADARLWHKSAPCRTGRRCG